MHASCHTGISLFPNSQRPHWRERSIFSWPQASWWPMIRARNSKIFSKLGRYLHWRSSECFCPLINKGGVLFQGIKVQEIVCPQYSTGSPWSEASEWQKFSLDNNFAKHMQPATYLYITEKFPGYKFSLMRAGGEIGENYLLAINFRHSNNRY